MFQQSVQSLCLQVCFALCSWNFIAKLLLMSLDAKPFVATVFNLCVNATYPSFNCLTFATRNLTNKHPVHSWNYNSCEIAGRCFCGAILMIFTFLRNNDKQKNVEWLFSLRFFFWCRNSKSMLLFCSFFLFHVVHNSLSDISKWTEKNNFPYFH